MHAVIGFMLLVNNGLTTANLNGFFFSEWICFAVSGERTASCMQFMDGSSGQFVNGWLLPLCVLSSIPILSSIPRSTQYSNSNDLYLNTWTKRTKRTLDLYLYRYRIVEMFWPQIDWWCVTLHTMRRKIQVAPTKSLIPKPILLILCRLCT